jgi:hypothetical protein
LNSTIMLCQCFMRIKKCMDQCLCQPDLEIVIHMAISTQNRYILI